MATTEESYSVGVVGASGYAGAELLRMLNRHPNFRVDVAAAGSNAGQPVATVHPSLIGLGDLVFSPTSTEVLDGLDLVFLALPHGESAALTDQLPQSLRIVDLGADHRLQDPAAWSHYYGGDAAQPWTYGLPELPGRRADIEQATRIANPGCYATALQLAAAPLLSAGLAEPQDVVAVAASGTSGAGRKASIPHSATEVMGSMSAYRVGGTHQHTAEVVQELSTVAGSPVTLSFTPLLAPMPRGILATITLVATPGASQDTVSAAMHAAYDDAPFVFVLPDGQSPSTSSTLGTNCAQLQVQFDDRSGRIVVVTAIDNLGKGAAGQAIQNANLMFGLPEATGLDLLGVAP